ncbi:aromatic ring-hydroxylating oxygenase subunit alpha [Emcibacter nanhaiensis]|uniref:Rieske 2Fe-2S domain-containing protein n=1 Tax=Emcibacter nanhaiensis TaxID=1505037 RepID=A0A501PTN9_9PROT|nr:aromatic ring-hydroxylating dioxygenase subunit alpha [Emcibacter nanhaiensis]TPD63793.1 Rieske 2Fe-2S domain-containing protein [Emcibacter nanhaiensis]
MSQKAEIRPDLVWPTDVTDVPKEVFVREDIFEQELEDIFYGPYWHPVAHEAEIPNPGDFKLFDLGRVPLLIARGDDNVVRVFINACSHRGNQVETSPCGNSKGFECPYHRWSFKNDGSLLNCPGSEDFSPKFSKEKYGLKEVKQQNLYGLILVTLSDNPPEFNDWVGRTAETIKNQIGHEGGLKLLGYQKVKYASNWKAYMDNDGYHAPLLHTGFRLLGWQSGGGRQFYTEHCHGGAESQLKPGKSMGVLKDESLIEFKDADWDSGSFVSGLFPITIMVKHLDCISIRFAIPRSVDSTEVHYAYFAKNDDSEEMALHRVRQASNLLGPCGMISMEDAAIFQRIQIGSHSPGVATFQKGVKDLHTIPTDILQNDETTNIPRWEYYRKLMGFHKEGEA